MPGATLLTVMLSGPSSFDSSLAIPTTPMRKLVESTELARYVFTERLMILMMRPLPVLRRWGMTRRLRRTVLSRLSSKADCQALSSKDSNLPKGGPPALLTSISIFPNVDALVSTNCAAWVASFTSTGMANTRPLLLARSSSAVRSSVSGLRAPMTISAPSAASAAAQALPSPLLAARISAVLPLSWRSMIVKIGVIKIRGILLI